MFLCVACYVSKTWWSTFAVSWPFDGRTEYIFEWKMVSFFLAIIDVLLLGDNGVVFLSLDMK